MSDLIRRLREQHTGGGRYVALGLFAEAADRIEALEAERDRNLDSINVGNKIITDLRGENAVLAGLLRDCDAVLAVIDADDGDEAEKVRDLRKALVYALDPYKREGTLL
jgi:hypothetical protein